MLQQLLIREIDRKTGNEQTGAEEPWPDQEAVKSEASQSPASGSQDVVPDVQADPNRAQPVEEKSAAEQLEEDLKKRLLEELFKQG